MRVMCVLMAAVCSFATAAEKFFPTVDANGRMIVIKSPAAADSKLEAIAPVAPPAAVDAAKPAPKVVVKQGEAKPEAGAVDKLSETQPYTFSEELEQKGYKPEGKNRFYYLPDGSMGKTPLESDNGVPVWTQPAAGGEDPVPSVRPSPNYQVLSAAELTVYGVPSEQCLSARALKKARTILHRSVFRVYRPLNEDPRQPDMVLSLKNIKPDSALFMVTHSDSIANPGFYSPVVVFRDAKGCVVSGAWNYWAHQNPATELRFESLEGTLLVGDGVAYVTLHHPLDSITGKLPFSYQREGSFSVEIYE